MNDYNEDLPYYLLFGYNKYIPTILDKLQLIFKRILFAVAIGYIVIRTIICFL